VLRTEVCSVCIVHAVFMLIHYVPNSVHDLHMTTSETFGHCHHRGTDKIPRD